VEYVLPETSSAVPSWVHSIEAIQPHLVAIKVAPSPVKLLSLDLVSVMMSGRITSMGRYAMVMESAKLEDATARQFLVVSRAGLIKYVISLLPGCVLILTVLRTKQLLLELHQQLAV